MMLILHYLMRYLNHTRKIYVLAKNAFSQTASVGLTTLSDRGADTSIPTLDGEGYGIYFNAKDVLSDDDQIYYRSAATTWTAVDLNLTATYVSPMAVFDYGASLVVGNYNTVQLVDTSWASVKSMVIPSQHIISSLDVNNNVIYIGTLHHEKSEAKLFVWDGRTTAFNSCYGVSAPRILAVRRYKGSVAVLTSKGKLLQFNGGGFTELAQLPVGNFDWNLRSSYNVVTHGGMMVDNEKIYISLRSEVKKPNGYYSPYFPSGLWCYDEKNGLYCLSTPSYTRAQTETITTANVNITNNTLTVASAYDTGTPVMYACSSTIITGLQNRKIYYAISISPTIIKLAETRDDALNGIGIDITGTGHNSQTITRFLINDYGFGYTSNCGAVDYWEDTIMPYLDPVVFSSYIFNKAGTATGVFNVTVPQLENRGYFITPKLNSSALEDVYNTISIKYKPLKDGDSILVKYRTTEKLNYPFGTVGMNTTSNATWVDSTTFTTLKPIFVYF